MTLRRVAEADIDVVVTGLHAEHGLDRAAEQRAVNRAGDAGAAVDAIVVLVELIAVDRIRRVPGEVVEQV